MQLTIVYSLKYIFYCFLNSGISVNQYRAAVRDGTDLPFVCSPCADQQAPDEMDVTQNYSEITDTSSRIVLTVPAANDPIEST